MDPGKAARAAKRASKRQVMEIAKQRKIEVQKAREEDDELGRKKLRAKTGGRSLLQATTATGRARNTTLGGE